MSLERTMSKQKNKDIFSDTMKVHIVWHKFRKFLEKNFSSSDIEREFETEINGVKTKHKMFNEVEFSRRIVGHEAMTKIRNYAKKNPKIRIVGCDDSVHASSMIVLIPHPTMGITMMFVPQCTGVQNEMFLYPSHYKMLLDALNEMRYTYKGSYFEDVLEEE